jgi:hypothetical protein
MLGVLTPLSLRLSRLSACLYLRGGAFDLCFARLLLGDLSAMLLRLGAYLLNELFIRGVYLVLVLT